MIRPAILALFLWGGAASAEPHYSHIPFEDLSGWAEDDHDAALLTFRQTCDRLGAADWDTLCAFAADTQDGRAFFELFFQPVLIEDGNDPLFTGYFEPELRGARQRSARYRYPVYKMPAEARRQRPWLTRRQIETGGTLRGRRLEIAYVDNPVDLFFLQIQGSGRIRLEDGSVIRLGYGGSNGRPYSSLGQRMVRRGLLGANEASAANIRVWVGRNLQAGLRLMRETQSYVFFTERDLDSDDGPIGAMSRSLTELRSIAVDPEYTPLGAPVWVEMEGAQSMQQLMVAQDVGSAIKGAQRADIFFGFGNGAGRAAGQVRDIGRMVVLLPIQRAFALLPEVIQ